MAFWHDVDEPEMVLVLADEVIALCREKGLDFWGAIAESARGWALVHGGAVDAGLELIANGLARYRATGALTPTGIAPHTTPMLSVTPGG